MLTNKMISLQQFVDILLHPTFIEYADYHTLCNIFILNKYHYKFILKCDSDGIDRIGFWKGFNLLYYN